MSPHYFFGPLWIDAKQVCLLNDQDQPAVEVINPKACAILREYIQPAPDYLCECAFYCWLESREQRWFFDRIYQIDLYELMEIGYKPSYAIFSVLPIPPEYQIFIR